MPDLDALTAPYTPRWPELTARGALVVAPDGAEGRQIATRLQDAIGDAIGQQLAIVAGTDLPAEAWDTHDLVVAGNLLNNPAYRRLYVHHHGFADAEYPGGGGFSVQSVADPFGTGRGCILVSGSTTAGLWLASDALARILRERGASPGRVHDAVSDRTDVPIPTADELASTLRDCRAAFLIGSGVGSVHRAIEAGLLYHLTGKTEWARLFQGILADYTDVARQHGTYAFEHMLFIYSWLWKLVIVWDLIEDDPYFADSDRLAMGNCLLELGRYLRTLPHWPEKANPAGEPRQNHSTFAALSLYHVQAYLRKAYGVTELDDLLPAADRIMRGQATSSKCNDDAGGGYVWLVPRHALDYTLSNGDWGYLERGKLKDLANLAIITTDNRRDECSYGDNGGYTPWERLGRPGSLKILTMAAWYYGDGRYAWAYRWLGKGKAFEQTRSLAGPAAWSEFYDGQYASELAPVYPVELTGVRAAVLDESAVGWVAHRAGQLGWAPQPGQVYFDKLAFRRDFDPASEYLCLEGPSAYAHGHQDGNSVTRLTWRDRLWLPDLDYIRYRARHHSSMVVARDGEDQGPPPLTSLDYLADLPSAGLTSTTARGYSGADWRRRIVWAPGRFFLVMDDVEAREPGEYSTQCLWRLLGDVQLRGRHLECQQAGEALHLTSSGASSLQVVEEEPTHLSRWDSYRQMLVAR